MIKMSFKHYNMRKQLFSKTLILFDKIIVFTERITLYWYTAQYVMYKYTLPATYAPMPRISCALRRRLSDPI